MRFRNKVTGWKDSHFTAVYGDGTVDTAPLFRTEYGRAFGRALFLRPSCYRCPYTSMTRAGDLTLGDFWGLRPDELPDQQEKGVSLLLVNTPHGSHIFDQLPAGQAALPAGAGHCRKSPAGISHSPAAGADGILCRLCPGALRPGAPGVLPPAAAAGAGGRPAAVAGGQGGHPEEAEVTGTVSHADILGVYQPDHNHEGGCFK